MLASFTIEPHYIDRVTLNNENYENHEVIYRIEKNQRV